LTLKIGNFSGAHYNPNNLAKFVAIQIFESISPNLFNKIIRILDPAMVMVNLFYHLLIFSKPNNISNFEVFGLIQKQCFKFAKSRINNSIRRLKLI